MPSARQILSWMKHLATLPRIPTPGKGTVFALRRLPQISAMSAQSQHHILHTVLAGFWAKRRLVQFP